MNLHSHIYAFNDILHECICTSIEKAVVRLGCTITHICIKRYTTRIRINWNQHTYAFKNVIHECTNTDTHTHMHSRIYYMNAYKTTLTHICIQGYTAWTHMNLRSHIYAFNDILHECICPSIEKAVVRLGCTITHIWIERYTTRMHINWNRHAHVHSRIYYMNV